MYVGVLIYSNPALCLYVSVFICVLKNAAGESTATHLMKATNVIQNYFICHITLFIYIYVS